MDRARDVLLRRDTPVVAGRRRVVPLDPANADDPHDTDPRDGGIPAGPQEVDEVRCQEVEWVVVEVDGELSH